MQQIKKPDQYKCRFIPIQGCFSVSSQIQPSSSSPLHCHHHNLSLIQSIWDQLWVITATIKALETIIKKKTLEIVHTKKKREKGNILLFDMLLFQVDLCLNYEHNGTWQFQHLYFFHHKKQSQEVIEPKGLEEMQGLVNFHVLVQHQTNDKQSSSIHQSQ